MKLKLKKYLRFIQNSLRQFLEFGRKESEMLKSEHCLKAMVFLMFLIAIAFVGATAHSAWQPPIVIPAPTFGINEVAPPTPNPWTTPTPGFYYVNNQTGSDTNNPYGTPAAPRKTIPYLGAVLPAGAVVEVHGVYAQRHSGA